LAVEDADALVGDPTPENGRFGCLSKTCDSHVLAPVSI
jgi:hypothetical protein